MVSISYNPPVEYDFEKLGKAIVVSRFKDLQDPYPAAGEVARKIAVSAVAGTRGKQDPRVTVVATCRGVMAGMLLLELDLAKTAVSILVQMGTLAQEAGLDPGECMTWAMEGMADVCKVAQGQEADAVSSAIERQFMGAGQVFDSLLRGAGSA